MIAILPVSLYAADDTAAAMLRSNGVGVLVNKNSAPSSTALFKHDLIETQKDAAARFETTGSSADINPETIVQFEGNELVLDHGSASVNTSRGLRVRVGCITVTPVNDAEWTHYDVADMDGKVTVSALKNDVYIDARSKHEEDEIKPSERSNRTIVHEGEQKSRDEKCGAAIIKESGQIAGRGALMNSPWAIGAGLTGIGLLCLLVCKGDDPISPSHP